MNGNPAPITIDEQALARYLLDNPAFFQRHAAVLEQVQLGGGDDDGNDDGAGAARPVSLHARQIEILRQRIAALEAQVRELLQNSHENAAIADKLHAWTGTLLRWHNPHTLPQAVSSSLQRHFNVPQVALRLWDLAPAYADNAATAGVSADARTFAASLTQPFCGPNRWVEPVQWLPGPQQVQSLALLTLRARPPPGGRVASTAAGGASVGADAAFGMLVLASPDAQRFAENMGIDFLQRIAESASAALSRLR